MKTATKSELRIQIDELSRQNMLLLAELEKNERAEWERKRPAAIKRFYAVMGEIFPGGVKNVQLEHIDRAGYWFTFELPQDERRQTYAIRHSDIY